MGWSTPNFGTAAGGGGGGGSGASWDRAIDIDFSALPTQDMKNGGVVAAHDVAGYTGAIITRDPAQATSIGIVNGTGLQVVSAGSTPGFFADLTALITDYTPKTHLIRAYLQMTGALGGAGQFLYMGAGELQSGSLTSYVRYALLYVHSPAGTTRGRCHNNAESVFDEFALTGFTDRSMPSVLAYQVGNYGCLGYYHRTWDWTSGVPALTDLVALGFEGYGARTDDTGDAWTTADKPVLFIAHAQGAMTVVCKRLVIDVLELP